MSLHYYPFVNRMIKLSGLRDTALISSLQARKPLFQKPFITISRDPGSGGALVAKKVTDKLGFELVDKQIIDEIAKSTKKRKTIIKGIDEKARTSIEDLVHSLLNKDYVSDYQYIVELSRVVLTYAHKGHVVILGRGANFITPDSKGLRVRVTAPTNVRRMNEVKFESVTAAEAKERISKTEKDRVNFIKRYFKKNVRHTSYYDLLINTTYLSLDDAADLIIEAFYKKFSRVERYMGIFKG